MKHVSLALLFLGICNQLSAMEKQPTDPIQDIVNRLTKKELIIPVSTIYNRLNALGLTSFIHNTNIHKKLGDQLCSPFEFVMKVENEILVHLKDLRNRSTNLNFVTEYCAFMYKMSTPIILAILKDHPTEIEKLQKEGFLDTSPTQKITMPWIENKQILQQNSRYTLKTIAERRALLWQVFISNK